MELPRFNKNQISGYFGDFKSRMGFSQEEAASGRRQKNQDAFFDDETDYGEYGYDEDAYFDDSFDDVVTNEFVEEPVRSSDRGSLRNSSRRDGISSPKLVSLEDVRARTTIPESLNRNPLPARRVTSGDFRSDRTMVDTGISTHANTPNARGYALQNQERSESLGSLFDSTDSSSKSSWMQTEESFDDSLNQGDLATGRIQQNDVAPSAQKRAITLIRPTNYGEAENVVDGLKQGDAVVIALADTPDALGKRILDFAFGAACALGAEVDCVGNKVFALTVATPLSQAEKTALKKQGVL